MTTAEPDQATTVDAVSALSIDADELTRRLDRLNLTQALLDFELANARVLDLTARLVESNKRVLALQNSADGVLAELDATRLGLDGARIDIAELQRRLAEVEGSTTYRAARKLGSLTRLRRFFR
jgi:hypothetical protein